MVLSDPAVDVAVLETARGGLLRAGMGYRNCDVSCCLNVAADHLGLRGIDTLEQLAEVKRIPIEVTTGTVVLNANRIEAGEDFQFYRSMTPSVTRFLEIIDQERLSVARAFGVELDSAREWLQRSYEGAAGETLHERIHSNPAYQGIKAPKSLGVRHLLEDVPTGLVPLASLGALAGVPTPACRAVIDISCGLLDRDFWAEGRNARNLGLSGMGIEEIREFVSTGVRAP